MNVDLSWPLYNDIADEYERVMVPHFFEPVASHLVSLLPLRCGQRLLDVACGTGVVGKAALQRLDELCVVGQVRPCHGKLRPEPPAGLCSGCRQNDLRPSFRRNDRLDVLGDWTLRERGGSGVERDRLDLCFE
jgi:hypothetical protein